MNSPVEGLATPSVQKTLLVFGIGKLGGPVVDALSILHPGHRFVIVSRDLTRSKHRANLSRYLAAQYDNFPKIIAEETNLFDPTRTAELINRYRPDVVFNATTSFPWWKLDQLPNREKTISQLAGPGMWCALDCALPFNLTQALSLAQSNAIYVNACYPDMTNAFLAAHLSAPRLGIGNISNLVPGLKLGWADELEILPEEVTVQIVGHHYVSWNAPSERGCPDAPYDLTITYRNRQLRFHGPDDTPFEVLRRRVSRTRGLNGLGVTVGSAVRLLDELLGGKPRRHHSPGANGLPGGYPIRLEPNGKGTLDLPADLNEGQAIEVNRQAQIFDGVLNVEAGKVLATSQAQDAYHEVVGAPLPEVTSSNVIGLALDGIARLEKRFSLGLTTK